MKKWLFIAIILSIVFGVSSFVWFLLGSTAFFQRGMDIIGTTIFYGVGIPVLFIAILFAMLLIKGWLPSKKADYIGICVGLVVIISFSISLIQSVGENTWANEKIRSDSTKITTDGKYEYRIDLVNLFQRNSHARLYLKDVITSEEGYIPVDIQTRKIMVLGIRKINHWVMLEPTAIENRYILNTTKELDIPKETFVVDTIAGTSSRLD